jgi:hypothetical protein
VHQVGYLTEINARCTVNKTLNFGLKHFLEETGGKMAGKKLVTT